MLKVICLFAIIFALKKYFAEKPEICQLSSNFNSYIAAIKMTTKIQPPVYKNCSCYDHYKVLVEAWEAVTDVAKNKQGIVIALSLQGIPDSKLVKRFLPLLKWLI